jgi:uncharacterized protein
LSLLIDIPRSSAAGVPEAPPADRIVDGAPRTQVYNVWSSVDDRVHTGVWSASRGAWKVSYDEAEYCEILAGACEITADGGDVRRYGPGDAFMIPPGFSGVWRVIEPMTKRYVIVMPDAGAAT